MSAAAPRRHREKPVLRLDHYLPYRLSVATNEVSQLVASAYQERFRVTIPQWRIIANVAEHGPQTPLQVSRHAVMDKVTVSRAAMDLVARGFLERRTNEADGRSHLLVLTPAGVGLHSEIAPLALALERALLNLWSEEEIAILHGQLRRLQHTASVLAHLGRT